MNSDSDDEKDITKGIVITQNYMHMCRLLLGSYNQLKRDVNDSSISDLFKKDVWLFFGPARTGKSTLLARLKSDLDSNSFYNKAILESEEKRNEAIDISGIKIKSGFEAMTTAPNFYTTGDRLIADLAGFVDADPKREAVVSILNNSLFPLLSSCRLFVILDLGMLLGLTINIQKYVVEFKKLLSENYFVEGMKACHFIFTKADKYEKSIIEISKINADEYKFPLKIAVKTMLDQFISDMITSDTDSGKFASYIVRRFSVIDYKTMNKDDIKKILNENLDNITPLVSRGMRFDLDKSTNILRAESAAVLSQYKKIVKKLGGSISEYKSSFIKDRMEIVNKVRKCKTEIDNLNQEKYNLKQSLASDEARQKILRLNQIADDEELKKFTKDLKDSREQAVRFAEKVNTFKLIHLTVVKSASYSRSFSGSVERILGNFSQPPGSDGKLQTMVMSLVDFNKFESRIYMCRLVSELEELKAPFITINGSKDLGSSGKVTVNAVDHQTTRVETELTNAHVLLCFNDIKVSKSSLVDIMTDYFTESITKTNTTIKTIQDKLKSDADELKTIDDSLIKNRESANEIEMDVKNEQQNLVNLKESLSMRADQFIQQISDPAKQMRSFTNDETFRLTKSISEVLVESKINTETYQEIGEIEKNANLVIGSEIQLRDYVRGLPDVFTNSS